MSCESVCASLWAGLQFEAVIVLMMCIRMLWLHCIEDMSGVGAPGMCFMILRRVCVPHSVAPGC